MFHTKLMPCLEARYTSPLAHHAFRLWTNEAGCRFPAPRRFPPQEYLRDEFPLELLVPRLGRFYPSRPLGLALPSAQFRVSGEDEYTFTFDCNPPWAEHRPELRELDLPAPSPALGKFADLLGWAGMETPLAGTATDYAEPGALRREDESPDGDFYAAPRLVDHLDATCRLRLEAIYEELLPPGGAVLDWMASWNSHVPAGRYALTALGLNEGELAANPAAQRRVVQDLNRDPCLPWAAASFDAALNTAALEYLTDPQAVLAEIWRVLKPGGLLAISFSNRYFAPKATRLWTLLHPMERLGWAAEQLAQGGFSDIHTLVEIGAARPTDDRHIDRTPLMDPLFAVWGSK